MSRTLRETLRPDLLTYSVSAVGPSAIYGVVMELRVTYCRELFFVPVKQFVPRLLAWVEDDPFDLACLARERIPLKSTATLVRMRATQVEVDAQASVVGSIG